MNHSVFALLLVVTALGSFAHAADTLPYRVEISSVKDRDIDSAVKATSDLRSLRKTAPVSPFGLLARARADVDRLKTALEGFGYYESGVAIRINGMPLDNPELGATLAALPAKSEANVAIALTLGPLYHLGSIDIDGELPEGLSTKLGLATGQPAVALTVLAGAEHLQTALQEQGYAFAKVDPPAAYEAPDSPELNLRFHVVVGAKVHIGEIYFEGLTRVHEALLRARLTLHTGAPFSPAAIEKERRDMLALGVFAQVSVEIGTAADDSGGVPITFKFRERLRHAIGFNAAYSTDLGGSVGTTWTDRNVFGNAEQLTLAAAVIDLGGTDTTGMGYDASAKYLIPDFWRPNQSLQFTVEAIKDSLFAYDQTALKSGATLTRKISNSWSFSVGATVTQETIIQTTGEETVNELVNGVTVPEVVGVNTTYHYTLLAVPVTVAFDSTNLASPLQDPRRGIRASLSVAPTLAIGRPDSTFVINQIKLAGYFDLDHVLPTAPGRTVLAARALAGLADGAGELSLPPDQRFYAGGSGTIRGYVYQSVGPKFVDPESTPIGGTEFTAGSLELRQRFGTNFGAALFADAGQVNSSLKAAVGQFDIGVGAGLRYYTPIGPIRLDVAVPTKRLPAPYDDAFEVYIGLGQAF